MSPLDDRFPGDTWARDLRKSRRRRRRPVLRWAFGMALLVAVGVGMFEVGQTFAPARPAAPAERFTGGGQAAVRAVPAPAPAKPARAAPPAPAKPRVLKLITRNIQSEADPNRVYLVPGRISPSQARHGVRPSFVVRPGEALRIRVDNQDQYVHSFTFAKSRVNLDAWEGEVSTSATFKAPTTPGTYQFYCRYRKVGMSGTLVVRGR